MLMPSSVLRSLVESTQTLVSKKSTDHITNEVLMVHSTQTIFYNHKLIEILKHRNSVNKKERKSYRKTTEVVKPGN